ncbi:hypothetical protein PoB_005708200 [Plakobranchus ocellatus]|uniref:Uncharacterized protein n=1 Tax=Plakobranchus ocellatus TaxID=259542 RepID=A0AAV4CGN7_9GAST|nr:hypothetical protein PoB_005708200 [Plakobranchus ocellatus]
MMTTTTTIMRRRRRRRMVMIRMGRRMKTIATVRGAQAVRGFPVIGGYHLVLASGPRDVLNDSHDGRKLRLQPVSSSRRGTDCQCVPNDKPRVPGQIREAQRPGKSLH